MNEACVVGVGMIPFGKYPAKSLTDLAWPAVKAAIQDAGMEGNKIQAFPSST